MPFPNIPEKHRAEALITPEKQSEYKQAQADGEMEEPPKAVIICYSRSLMTYFTETYEGRDVDHYYGDLYVFADTEYTVGVVGNFGIGAPTTATLLEELIVDGVEAVLSIGFAGCLDESVEMGEFVVCDKAIRDEGTSYHYAEAEKYAYASEPVVAATKQQLRTQDESFHVGSSWTTDAIYRETIPEIEQYAEEGVLTVEMEASAVFTVAAHRGVDAGAMFVVSDYLGLSDWDPKFHLTTEHMQQLGDTAKEVLDIYEG